MLNKSLLDQVNRKANSVLANRSWRQELQIIPVNDVATRAYGKLIDYVHQLQRQVEGLEEIIRNFR